MERHQHGKDWMSVLACSNASCREAFAVTNAIDVIDYRYLGIARQQEVSVQGMRRSDLACGHGTPQRAPYPLSPEHTLPADLRGADAKQVHFQRFEIKNIKQILDSRRHEEARMGQSPCSTCYAPARFTRKAHEQSRFHVPARRGCHRRSRLCGTGARN